MNKHESVLATAASVCVTFLLSFFIVTVRGCEEVRFREWTKREAIKAGQPVCACECEEGE